MSNFDVYINSLKRKFSELGVITPLKASYEITTLCNLSCEHCYNKHKKMLQQKHYSLDNKKNVISKLKELGVLEVTICGGEPFMDKDIISIIKYAKSLDLRLIILTNGLLLTTDVINQLNTLLNADDVIQLSVDDILIDEISNQRHLSLDQKTTLENCIYQLIEAKLNFVVNITPTSLNEHNLVKLFEQLHHYGVKNISVTPYVPMGSEKADSIKPDYSYLASIENSIGEYCKINNITYSGGIEGHVCQSFNVKEIINKNTQQFTVRKCDACEFNLHISCNGNIYPCVFMEKEQLLIGNICDAIEDIKSNIQIVNRKIKSNLPSKCISCDLLLECGGGCPGLIFDRYNTLDKIDPRCRR